jgi:hypothetical protein
MMRKDLVGQYMDMVYDYDMDLEEKLIEVLGLLEKVAPGVIQEQIELHEEYISDMSGE